MPDPRVAIISLDDWTILYVGGQKVAEGHSIPTRDVFEAGIPLDYRALDGTDFDGTLRETGWTPVNLSEVPHA